MIPKKPKQVKPLRQQRKAKINVDLEILPLAINIENKIVPIGCKVAFIRRMNAVRNEIHTGTIEKFDTKDEVITIWDSTKEQYYLINLHQSQHIKSITI